MDLKFSPEEGRSATKYAAICRKPAQRISSDAVRNGYPNRPTEMAEEWDAILETPRLGWRPTWERQIRRTGLAPPFRSISYEEKVLPAPMPRASWPFWPEYAGLCWQAFRVKNSRNTILPRIPDGTDWWCQGYSEPGAGGSCKV